MLKWINRLRSVYHAQDKINYWYDRYMGSFDVCCHLGDLLTIRRRENVKLRQEVENLMREKAGK